MKQVDCRRCGRVCCESIDLKIQEGTSLSPTGMSTTRVVLSYSWCVLTFQLLIVPVKMPRSRLLPMLVIFTFQMDALALFVGIGSSDIITEFARQLCGLQGHVRTKRHKPCLVRQVGENLT